MSLTALVCEKWKMDLHTPAGPPGEQWFLNWVMRKPKQSSVHVAAGWAAIKTARTHLASNPPQTAAEYFGGMGCWSIMLQHAFNLHTHNIIDSSALAVQHMQQALAGFPTAHVKQDDAYSARMKADLAVLDCGDMTAHRAINYSPLRNLLSDVFAQQPGAVILTDIAGPRLHLHRQLYARLLNHNCNTYTQYMRGLHTYLHQTYNYGMLKCYMHTWSGVMVLQQGHAQLTSDAITHVPQLPIGLTLCQDPD
jgi:hypothetical protein